MKTRYHYCWIQKLNRFLFDKNKHKTAKYYCDRCLHEFTEEEIFNDHNRL